MKLNETTIVPNQATKNGEDGTSIPDKKHVSNQAKELFYFMDNLQRMNPDPKASFTNLPSYREYVEAFPLEQFI